MLIGKVRQMKFDSRFNIKRQFLLLTQRTHPYGHESELESFLPKGFEKDIYGNYFYTIGNSKTIFASHLDNSCKNVNEVNHIMIGDMIETDGTTILGADDKAGVVVLLYMILNRVPGTYYFFIGEEVGCIGSGAISKNPDYFKNYERIISFDRRGTTSVITHQSGRRTCSDQFAREICSELNKFGLELEPDDGGTYTDSAEFVDIISECTNISVGYYNEHTFNEKQDIKYLTLLCKSVIKVSWENIKTHRNPQVEEYEHCSYKFPNSWNSIDYYKYRNSYEYYGNYSNVKNYYTNTNKARKNKRYLDNLDVEVDEYKRVISEYPQKNDNTEVYKRLIFDDFINSDTISIIRKKYLNFDS